VQQQQQQQQQQQPHNHLCRIGLKARACGQCSLCLPVSVAVTNHCAASMSGNEQHALLLSLARSLSLAASLFLSFPLLALSLAFFSLSCMYACYRIAHTLLLASIKNATTNQYNVIIIIVIVITGVPQAAQGLQDVQAQALHADVGRHYLCQGQGQEEPRD
jgi:hypothetical protein